MGTRIVYVHLLNRHLPTHIPFQILCVPVDVRVRGTLARDRHDLVVASPSQYNVEG